MFQTHGFPPELFETLAAEHNLAFDWDGFQRGDGAARRSSRAAASKIELFKHGPLDAPEKGHARQPSSWATKRSTSPTPRSIGIIANDQLCDQIDEVDHERPDRGRARPDAVLRRDGRPGGRHAARSSATASASRSIDTQNDGGFILHLGHLREGQLELGHHGRPPGSTPTRRQGIRRAHSATHLLHYALQKHLGKHAQQQGSKVDDDWLRFDFANPAAARPRGARRRSKTRSTTRIARRPSRSLGERCRMAEAREAGRDDALRREVSRRRAVVSMGEFSKELCGGTHLDNTGQVGLFKIVGEESVPPARGGSRP